VATVLGTGIEVPVVGSSGLLVEEWRFERCVERFGGLRKWNRGMADRETAMVRCCYGGRMVVVVKKEEVKVKSIELRV
jgi:hypothetical protein